MLKFGKTSVPWTVSWSAENDAGIFIAPCQYAGNRQAFCQIQSREGKPAFALPHAIRQRQAIVRCLCDLCGRSIRNNTKVSLSHARPRDNAVTPGDILQSEPLLHRECAKISMEFCPSLKRDIAAGTLHVRQVTRWRPQLAVMDPRFIHVYIPAYIFNPKDAIYGHAKVQLIEYTDRDLDWLNKKGGL